jgi:hypothetical protein
MAVISTSVSRVKPGRRLDAIAIASEAKKVLERHGSGECRLLAATTAGEQTGALVFTSEFESAEANGAFGDSLNGDAELEALLDRLSAEHSPVAMESQSLMTEIALDRKGKTGRGRYVEAYTSRVQPGGLTQSLDLTSRVFDFLEKRGARNARLFQLTLAGSFTDAYVVSWEWETLRARGAATDAFATDPKGQEIMQAVQDPQASTLTTLSSGLYTAIPI